MFALLNPRLIIAAVIAAFLCLSHLYVYKKGENHVRAAWDLDKARANSEARQIEQHRETVVGKALVASTARKVGLRHDSDGAADAVSRLRGAIATRDLAEESAAAATKRAAATEQLLLESAVAYQELARAADGHVNDIQTLLDAWPR